MVSVQVASVLVRMRHRNRTVPVHCHVCSNMGHEVRVTLYCDNERYISQRRIYLVNLLRCLFFIQAHFKFEVRAKHIAGTQTQRPTLSPATNNHNSFLSALRTRTCHKLSCCHQPRFPGSNKSPIRQFSNLDLPTPEKLVQDYFAQVYSKAHHHILHIRPKTLLHFLTSLPDSSTPAFRAPYPRFEVPINISLQYYTRCYRKYEN